MTTTIKNMSIGNKVEPTLYRAIQNDEAAVIDLLNRERYVEVLARLAENCETPIVIGLYGSWGSGKTSLMKLIEQKLNEGLTSTVWFDPWQHQFDENPVLSLLHTVVDRYELNEEVRKLLLVVATAFSSALLRTTTNVDIKDIERYGKFVDEERFAVREARVRMRKHFENIIIKAQAKIQKRIVFFIDDLDRCSHTNVLSLLEALKQYLNLKGCVYFLGVDRHELEKSIRISYKDLDISESSYLDKIVQLPFNIPPVPIQSMQRFIEPMLVGDLKKCNDLLVAGLGDNPRDVKRFINVLTIHHELALKCTIPGYDCRLLTTLALIQYRSYSLYKLLKDNPNKLFDLKYKYNQSTTEEYIAFFKNDVKLRQIIEMLHIDNNTPIACYVYLADMINYFTTETDESCIKERRRIRREKVTIKACIGTHDIFVVDSSELNMGFFSDNEFTMGPADVLFNNGNQQYCNKAIIKRSSPADTKSGFKYFYGADLTE